MDRLKMPKKMKTADAMTKLVATDTAKVVKPCVIVDQAFSSGGRPAARRYIVPTMSAQKLHAPATRASQTVLALLPEVNAVRSLC